MEIFRSKRLFRNFNPTLLKTFFMLTMSKQAPFKYPKCKLSNQMDSGALVKIITWKNI